MVKKNFDAFLPIIVTMAVLFAIVNTFSVIQSIGLFKYIYRQELLRWLLLFAPVLVLIQAGIYRRFSKKNRFRGLSWTYICLVGLSFCAPYLAAVVWWLYRRSGSRNELKDFVLASILGQYLVFALAAAAAVVVFVILVVKIDAQRFEKRSNPVNLLDDVIP